MSFESPRLDILLISTADWDNPYWTNKQHVAMQFANFGHRVFYVESQGLRAPTPTAKDVKRIWARLKRGLSVPRLVHPNVRVWSPVVIPFQGSAFIRKLNRLLLRIGVRFWTWRCEMRPTVMWTYSPLTTELYDIQAYSLTVYHAVDDIKAQPGMPRATIEAAERDLSSGADLIFTTAHKLQDAHRQLNPQTYYFSNVADYAHFNRALDSDTEVPADIAAIQLPRIGFVGAISSYKLDFAMIRELADAHPEWSFVFVGEIGEGDPLTDSSIFDDVSNIHFLGGRSYTSLPGYLKGMQVALLPNLINDYTRSMFPMKFFEYLAAGKRVVSTELPALVDYHHVASFCRDVDSFAIAVAQALADEGASLEDRLTAARGQTYEIRTAKMMRLVMEGLDRRADLASAKQATQKGHALK